MGGWGTIYSLARALDFSPALTVPSIKKEKGCEKKKMAEFNQKMDDDDLLLENFPDILKDDDDDEQLIASNEKQKAATLDGDGKIVNVAKSSAPGAEAASSSSQKETTTVDANRKLVDGILKQIFPEGASLGSALTWSLKFIASVNSDAASTPALTDGARLMQINDGLITVIVGDVNTVPAKDLVVVTSRAFKKGEFITFVPFDYVRVDNTDVVFDVAANASVRDTKELQRFEAYVRSRENFARAIDFNTSQNIVFMPDTRRKRRTGGHLGAFVGETLIEENWIKARDAVLPQVEKALQSGNDALAFRVFYKAYLQVVLARTNVICSLANADGQQFVLPLMAVTAAFDLPANTPLVLELGVVARVFGLADVQMRKRLYHAAYNNNKGHAVVGQELLKELANDDNDDAAAAIKKI